MQNRCLFQCNTRKKKKIKTCAYAQKRDRSDRDIEMTKGAPKSHDDQQTAFNSSNVMCTKKALWQHVNVTELARQNKARFRQRQIDGG